MKYDFAVKRIGTLEEDKLKAFSYMSMFTPFVDTSEWRGTALKATGAFPKQKVLSLLEGSVLNELFDPSGFIKAWCDRIDPMSYIVEHTDVVSPTDKLQKDHKVHVPLITSEYSGAMWAGIEVNGVKRSAEVHRLEKGGIYLYNNIDTHSVINLSSSYRYHLLLKYTPESFRGKYQE